MISTIIDRTSIGRRIVLLIVLVSMFSILIALAGLSANEHHRTQVRVKSELSVLSDVVATNITAALVFKDKHAATELLKVLKVKAIVEYANVEDIDGMPFAEYGDSTFALLQQQRGGEFFTVKTLLFVDDVNVGYLTLVANDQELTESIQLYYLIVFAVILISLVFSILLSVWVQRRFATPLIRLADVAKQIAATGNYSLQVTDKASGELGQLIEVFNSMVRKVDTREQALEALVLDRTTELEALNSKLEQQAYYDSLTKLPNRFLYEDRLKQSIAYAAREGSKVALMFIDLDNFKDVNDTWGHAAGDALLCQVSRRLEQQCRQMDSVARIGGDEFTMLFMLNDEHDDINEISRRIISVFQMPFDILDQPLVVTMSVGVAVYPTHGYDFDVLKAKADEAMYQAKMAGRNQFYIYR